MRLPCESSAFFSRHHTHPRTPITMVGLRADAPEFRPEARPKSASIAIPQASDAPHDLHDDLPNDPWALSNQTEVRGRKDPLVGGAGAVRWTPAPPPVFLRCSPRPWERPGAASEGPAAVSGPGFWGVGWAAGRPPWGSVPLWQPQGACYRRGRHPGGPLLPALASCGLGLRPRPSPAHSGRPPGFVIAAEPRIRPRTAAGQPSPAPPSRAPTHYRRPPHRPYAAPRPQMSVSPAELEELEEVEGWVNLMAELEVRGAGNRRGCGGV